MNRQLTARILTTMGRLLVLAGAVDPLEGALAILAGGGLIALGTWADPHPRAALAYRLRALALVVVGVAALWGISGFGGLGGEDGLSWWWGLTLLPYPIGWWLLVADPRGPRWVLGLGALVGLWYVGLAAMVGASATEGDRGFAIGLAVVGALIAAGCGARLWRRGG